MPSAKTQSMYRDLVEGYDDLLDLAGQDIIDLAAPRVSKWTVGQQLEHCAKVDQTILEQVEAGLDVGRAPADGSPKLPGRVLMWLGRIPRGRGKAPKPTIPEISERDVIITHLAQAKDHWRRIEPRLDEIERLPGTFPHPALGHFTAKQWLRFCWVHQRHHRAIIDDILAASA